MSAYFKFWLAKEIVSLWPLLLIFGGFGLFILGVWIKLLVQAGYQRGRDLLKAGMKERKP